MKTVQILIPLMFNGQFDLTMQEKRQSTLVKRPGSDPGSQEAEFGTVCELMSFGASGVFRRVHFY